MRTSGQHVGSSGVVLIRVATVFAVAVRFTNLCQDFS